MGNNDSKLKKDLSNQEIESYKYKLELKKMLIEKLFLSLIIGSVLFYANLKLEKHKDEISWKRYNQEKQYEAICAIKETFSEYETEVSEILRGRVNSSLRDSLNKTDSSKVSNYFINASHTLKSSVSKYSIYLKAAEIKNFKGTYMNYLGLVYVPRKDFIKYSGYFVQLNTNFRILCRRALNFEDDEYYYEYIGIPENTEIIRSYDFLNQNFNNWSKSHD